MPAKLLDTSVSLGEGVLPVIGYMGRLQPKGVFFRLEAYKRVRISGVEL